MKSLFLALVCCCSTALAQSNQSFSQLLGPITAKPVKENSTLKVPYITWGGDVAEFYANGGMKTAKGSINEKLGLNIELTKGDDFLQQVKEYMGGEPFLRGTVGMLGMASEVLNSDPRTKPVIIVQLTWSAGDYLVGREKITSLNDLGKGNVVKIALQQGGPHVHLLYQIEQLAQLEQKQVQIVWCPDLSGPNGPAEKFRNDPSIDAAFAITPDMLGLTGGLDAKGTGAEGTVKGAHVVVGTFTMNRAIADVWAVRSDWYQAHKDIVDKFVAGFLKASEETVALRKQFNDTNKLSKTYETLLLTAQSAFGKEVIPAIETDGHGLMLDALFVGLPGQVAFFEDKASKTGFDPSVKSVIDMAVAWGYAKNRSGFTAPGLNYNKIAGLAGIKYEAPSKTNRIVAEGINVFPDTDLDERTILSFAVNFEPNQDSFSVDEYGGEFNRVIANASVARNAVFLIRGHSDPTQTLTDLIKAGMAKQVDGHPLIERRGVSGSFRYFVGNREMNLESTDRIVALIKGGAFDGTNPNPRETMDAAYQLSKNRADVVRDAIKKYATDQGVNLDSSQLKSSGAGITEPLVAKPRNIDEAKKNMRVEFRLLRIPAEAIKPQDFDY